MLIDSHAHLDYEYDVSTEELLRNAKEAGVEKIITIAATVDSLDRAKNLADRFTELYFTSGIHPHDAKDFSSEIAEKIKQLAQHPKCVAIGELGLDYHYDLSDRSTQFSVFTAQTALALELGKPIIVHTREADADTLKILAPFAKSFLEQWPDRSPGVIHCFTGDRALAEACLQLGFYISFSGILTFKNAEDLREIVRTVVPLDKIMVETDSPYLAPIPHRGKKNQPAFTKFVAEKVAELKGLSLPELAKYTTANTSRLFRL